MKNHLLALSAVAVLAACGSGGDPAEAAGDAASAQAASAGFVDQVAATIARNSDSAEPASVDTATAATPEGGAAQPAMQ